jgi:hypothetical protein
MKHSRLPTSHRAHRKQRGAALIMGLLMLVVVTLLAISAVNTASSELIMAGNEQNRQRAFQAADAGIEPAIRTVRDRGQSLAVTWTNDVVMATAPTDQYDYSQQFVGDGPFSNSSEGEFVGLRYGVMARGESPAGDPRASRAELWVGAELFGGAAGSYTPADTSLPPP